MRCRAAKIYLFTFIISFLPTGSLDIPTLEFVIELVHNVAVSSIPRQLNRAWIGSDRIDRAPRSPWRHRTSCISSFTPLTTSLLSSVSCAALHCAALPSGGAWLSGLSLFIVSSSPLHMFYCTSQRLSCPQFTVLYVFL